MKQKYWLMCYTWYGVMTFGLYDFFGNDIRTIEYLGAMNIERYYDFEAILDKKL